MRHVVAAGSPNKGFTLHGPFDTALEAYDYAHNGPDTDGLDWWVMPLNEPAPWVPTIEKGGTRCLFCGHIHHDETEPLLASRRRKHKG